MAKKKIREVLSISCDGIFVQRLLPSESRHIIKIARDKKRPVLVEIEHMGEKAFKVYFGI